MKTNTFLKALKAIIGLEVGLWKTAQEIAKDAIRTGETEYYRVRCFCVFRGKEKTLWFPKA